MSNIIPMTDKMSAWLPLDQALHRALYDPITGYYNQKNPLGRSGDFITAPEISQLFGEMIGLWCIEKWQQAGCPTPVRLIEFGPGRGIMMSDVLRIFKLVPPLLDAVTCHLIEVSEPLREIQKETLKNYNDRLFWHNDLNGDEIPEGFTLILANEFFDALPISQYIFRKDGWIENGISKGGDNSTVFEERPCGAPSLRFTPDLNQIIEICPFDQVYTQRISNRLKEKGGAALIIDYGDDQEKWQGETLQALLNHKKVSVLEYLGQADISHHVDFRGLRWIFMQEGLMCSQTETQGDFLRQLGIELRADQLAKKMDGAARVAHLTAVHRLIGATEMGVLFKVLEIYHARS